MLKRKQPHFLTPLRKQLFFELLYKFLAIALCYRNLQLSFQVFTLINAIKVYYRLLIAAISLRWLFINLISTEYCTWKPPSKHLLVFKTSPRQAKFLLVISVSNKSKCVSNKSLFHKLYLRNLRRIQNPKANPIISISVLFWNTPAFLF